jgi:hypothetical protein
LSIFTSAIRDSSCFWSAEYTHFLKECQPFGAKSAERPACNDSP